MRSTAVLCLLTTVALLGAGEPFLESGGRVVVEVESAPQAGSWTAETYLAGYTGSGFFEWKKGNTSMGIDAAGSGILSYPVTIATAGRYRLQIRARPAHNTEHNDVWVRILGATKVEAVRTNGSDVRNLGTNWTKAYNNNPSSWNWDTWTVDHDPHAIYAEFTAGAAATIELSGRSTQFRIDRLVLYQPSLHTEAQATSTALAESPRGSGPAAAITGELKRWHKVTLSLNGPSASETGTPNPFTDYRFDVTFANGALSYVVPGYFAADGNAGETSATSGSTWRAHLSPDLTGTWTWTVSFRQGANVAQNGGGTTLSPYHGLTGTFTVGETDKSGRDFRGKGRLEYVGQRYLRHKGNGEWFLKAGADAPENFLNNTEFDNTVTQSGTDHRHAWTAHVGDWQAGDPSWKSGKGRGVIGALNYLAGTGCNVFSFLTMNINGDSKDVWPYIAHDQRLRMDCSKLDQWEVLFAHAGRKGMYMHIKLQEEENERLLDNGDVGPERRLYYRELIARFGHHLALNWNLGEENGPPVNAQTDQQRKDMAQWFWDNDPYRHHVVIHTRPGNAEQDAVYVPLLGSASRLTGASLQVPYNSVHARTLHWINASTAAGRPWVVANDEQGGHQDGIPPQPGWPGYGGGGPNRAELRHHVLWGNLMAGGAGIEAYFGYLHPQSDLTCRDWRSRADWWAMCSHALAFFRSHLPFHEMTAADGLVNGGNRWCLAKAGQVYAVYVPAGAGGSATLNLGGQAGTYNIRWYDPRGGGALANGTVTAVDGGSIRDLGAPPSSSSLDWVILVTRTGDPPANLAPMVNAGPDLSVTLPADAALDGTVTDDGLPAGSTVTTAWTKISGPGTVTFGNAAAVDTTAAFSAAGTYVLRLTASDTALSAHDEVTVTVHAATSTTTTAINAGGGASGGFAADAGFSGGGTYTTSTAVSTAGVANAAPAAVYQSERYGSITYTVGGLTPHAAYTVRLHFAEIYWTTTGQRVFNVAVNSVPALTGFDIVAAAGGAFTAVVRDVSATANSSGTITIALTSTVSDAKLSGLEVLGSTPPANAAPTVNAGPDQAITLPAQATLAGSVSDDGLPVGSTVTVVWSKVSGPGTVTFANAAAAATTAAFSAAGTYVLRLTASDTQVNSNDEVTVTVLAAPSVNPPASSTVSGSGTGDSGPCGAGAVAGLLLFGLAFRPRSNRW